MCITTFPCPRVFAESCTNPGCGDDAFVEPKVDVDIVDSGSVSENKEGEGSSPPAPQESTAMAVARQEKPPIEAV